MKNTGMTRPVEPYGKIKQEPAPSANDTSSHENENIPAISITPAPEFVKAEYTNKAVKKLDGEVKNFKGNKYSNIMYKDVAKALKYFCKQNDEFAQAVVQSGKTFSACMEQVAKNITNGISDLEAYRRAAQFYFKGADIHYTMTIDLCGELKDKPIEMTKVAEPVKAVPKEAKASCLSLSLDDLLN